jgi:hypothetical protein
MAVRTLKLALLAIVAIVFCSVYAQATEKSAIKVDVDVSSFSTQEIEEQLQVFTPCR